MFGLIFIKFSAENPIFPKIPPKHPNFPGKTSKLHEGSAGEWFINTAFAGLRRWDAQYFLFIVDNDYLLEKCLAFFPGFVMVIRIFRMAGDLWLKGLFGISLDPYVVTGFLAVGFNMLFFYLTGLVLFILTYQICRSVKIGMLAVSIFAYNPASIFFSAAYSESLYSLTTFAPLLFILLAVRLDNVLARSFGVLMSVVFFAGGVLIR
ncbi:unnamed protein product [Caenorhabditis angaria]|uniref:GPI mannosyltransferase 2 n=1 Tax=Caenorhabditis angaria TaxID=860376 RepID=A0A9P1IA98_9PELO|nr:unnamed protein product [Caenorhabditis angaria]